MDKSTKIAPSILAADFTELGDQIRAVEAAGADWLHFDVMDGHFVPNISFGIPVLNSVKPFTRLPCDVHLMIDNADRYLDDFAKVGADRITVHVEASPHLHRSIGRIHELGLKAGVALNPATPLAQVEEVLDQVDLVLIMTVNPGFGGQHFIPQSLEKVKALRRKLSERGLEVEIEVD
ncbi:MAG: ribulose-phosphate 3-epimerase, partial [Chloroflexi bacterium]|nr:ribulose-phosphate 3-epimerase [Chloroflexota bacterium]